MRFRPAVAVATLSLLLGACPPLAALAAPGDAVADLVLGQASFKRHFCNRGVGAAAAANTLCGPTGVAVDAQGRVWIADELNNRVLGYDAPFASVFLADQPASRVLGQASLAGRSANRGGSVGAATLNQPRGLAIDTDGNLWVTDRANFRVLMFEKPFVQDGTADFVLGQSSLTSNASSGVPSADVIGSPFGIHVDGPGNVYVADSGMNRVLVYQKPLAAGGGTPARPAARATARPTACSARCP